MWLYGTVNMSIDPWLVSLQRACAAHRFLHLCAHYRLYTCICMLMGGFSSCSVSLFACVRVQLWAIGLAALSWALVTLDWKQFFYVPVAAFGWSLSIGSEEASRVRQRTLQNLVE